MESGNSDKLNSSKPIMFRSERNRERNDAYEAKDDRTVWTMSRTKNPIEIGGLGNQYTMNVAMNANTRRGQNA